jgi:hypothetical protein
MHHSRGCEREAEDGNGLKTLHAKVPAELTWRQATRPRTISILLSRFKSLQPSLPDSEMLQQEMAPEKISMRLPKSSPRIMSQMKTAGH